MADASEATQHSSAVLRKRGSRASIRRLKLVRRSLEMPSLMPKIMGLPRLQATSSPAGGQIEEKTLEKQYGSHGACLAAALAGNQLICDGTTSERREDTV